MCKGGGGVVADGWLSARITNQSREQQAELQISIAYGTPKNGTKTDDYPVAKIPQRKSHPMA